MADQPQKPLSNDLPAKRVLDTSLASRADKTQPRVHEPDEKFVPPWCTYGLEGSLWLLMALGVLGHDLLTPELWRSLLPVALGLVGAAWVAHLFYLRETAFFVSWPVAALGLAAGGLLYFVPPAGAPWIGGSPLVPLALLLIFIVVSCLLTELQVARLLVFNGAMAALAGLAAMAVNLPGRAGHLPGAPDIFQPAWLGSEREMAVLLMLGVILVMGFAVWALAAWMPARNAFSAHSRVLSLSSPGFNLAIMGIVLGLVMMVPMFRLELVWALPVTIIMVLLLLFLGTIRGIVAPWSLVLLGVILGVVLLANLARAQGFWPPGGSEEFKANLASLLAGTEQRVWNPEAERFGEMVMKQEGPALALANGQFDLARPDGPWHGMFRVPGNWGVFLLAAFGVALLVQAVRGLWDARANVNGLAAVALVGVLTIGFLLCLTQALNHLGMAFLATVIVGIAATRGEFDQEYQED